VPKVFFSLGATELSGEAAKASREAARQKALLTLSLLAAGEREDLWHPGKVIAHPKKLVSPAFCRDKSQRYCVSMKKNPPCCGFNSCVVLSLTFSKMRKLQCTCKSHYWKKKKRTQRVFVTVSVDE